MINYNGIDPWGRECAYIKRETMEDYIKWNIIAEAFNKYSIEELEERLNEENTAINLNILYSTEEED
jgi:hypothetical protein